ncbi:H(+)/Cl(-) exchange transporter 7-like isoform X2 [Eriocheir sinensis]|uniref:H(+)/Cl(-) exchange transporter 7-like isoform X2 n=1 Tax=Eriocheir sinensis TaxID=95602 RepID=UPI0021C6ED98|nr:H(+)/Cl(-) exchange transporter 7-like isoform X2 [Eriocheir sinensis]
MADTDDHTLLVLSDSLEEEDHGVKARYRAGARASSPNHVTPQARTLWPDSQPGMDSRTGAKTLSGLAGGFSKPGNTEEKEMVSFPAPEVKSLKVSTFERRNHDVAVSSAEARVPGLHGEDVPDFSAPSPTTVGEEGEANHSGDGEGSDKIGNSIFYVDHQQESPSDENRGNLNMLSAAYESLDYDTCVNSAWLDEERKKGYTFVVKKDVARWLVVLVTAVLTALIACGIDIAIESLSKYKYTWLQTYTDYGVQQEALIIPYLLFVTLNVGPTLVAAFLGSYVEPVSAGSGIPQVKCYLNGVKVPRVVRIKTLMSKAVGVTFSVLGGLAVGKEGPMIHSGAVIAAGVSQGKTTSFKHDFGFFEYFREDHEKRDFVSAGAAAGVAAAFGAPVGGVLFSLEEGASFWNQSLTWRVFFGAMMSAFTLNLVLSAFNGVPGKLNYNGLLNFGKFEDLTYEIWEFVPFLLMGVMGGLLGALFNFINLKLTALRMRYITRPWQKIVEACLVASTTATVAFLMIYGLHDCRKIEEKNEDHYPIQMFCDDGEESAVAAIWFQTPEKSVRALLHDPSRRSVSMEVKRGIRNSIILPTVVCIRGVDVECSTAMENTCSGDELYKRCLCVSGWDGASNESVCERFGMGATAIGVECGVWSGCIEMVWTSDENGGECMREGLRREGCQGRTTCDRASEYWSERVGSSRIECAERECQNRERWRHFCCGHPDPWMEVPAR